jgi:hypothetical protein
MRKRWGNGVETLSDQLDLTGVNHKVENYLNELLGRFLTPAFFFLSLFS